MTENDNNSGRPTRLFLMPSRAGAKPSPAEAGGLQGAFRATQGARTAALLKELSAEFSPLGATEIAMVQTMAEARWRAEFAALLRLEAVSSADPKKIAALDLYRTTQERSFRAALKTLKTLQNARPRPRLVRSPKKAAEY